MIIRPRDLRPGMYVERARFRTGYAPDPKPCRVVEVKWVKVRMQYYVKTELPSGWHPNEIADHFYVSPHAAIGIVSSEQAVDR